MGPSIPVTLLTAWVRPFSVDGVILAMWFAVSFFRPIGGVFPCMSGNQEYTMRLYSGTKKWREATTSKASTLINGPGFDPQRVSVFYFFGHNESPDNGSAVPVINGYMSRGDHNVWLVDWRPLSGARYRCSVVGVPGAARHVAAAIHSLGLPERQIHLVGHSMGAQLAATVGKLFQGRLRRITALDPALPLFSILSHVTSISAGDAQNVDVIHTDGGIYGIMGPVGTVDFYPNAGTRRQPGCSPKLILINDLCSHHRSFMMYAESLMRPTAFPAVWCTSWKEFTSGTCNNTQTAYMGILATIDSNTRGSYFLRTGTSFPFGLGKEGVYVPQLPTTASPLPENEIRGHSG
ncbi:pancreatic triacylglycerol lipase-like [Schistocerca piceifrons]|uniref:pancreatic triacylglycerol lipase-like n=1 Tax=Schistocerca piceifrons TaxID=274613 RepID=UPI001F5FB897|nr:pancreatic triacylglycerol lipase-like [Schistocerca piceifrons]